MKKLGLIINPIAGMGGRVGLKGTDGSDILEKAKKLRAKPQSEERTRIAVERLVPLREKVELMTCRNRMGERVAADYGFLLEVIDVGAQKKTAAADTQKAAIEMRDSGVDLLLFAGGDGTARDVYKAVGGSVVVLGIPTGVKIHSAVFASNPAMAGELAALYFQGKTKRIQEVEVMDIDEEDYRNGILSARLYGYLRIPFRRNYVQNRKTGSLPAESFSQEAIAAGIVENMSDDFFYIIGPGTTTRAIMDKMGLDNTLLGIDLVYRKKLIGKDLSESELLKKIKGKKAKLIITPIGGQGFLLGRGNQQISPEVILNIGKENIVIVTTPQKIHSFHGHPLLVDTGHRATDQLLSDYFKVITGYRESIIYKITDNPVGNNSRTIEDDKNRKLV